MDKRYGSIWLDFLHALVLKIGVMVQRLLRVPAQGPKSPFRSTARKLPLALLPEIPVSAYGKL